MVSRYSLALVFATVFACMVFGARPAAADGPAIQITAPQNGATLSGDTFELSWTSDPAVVGTAVAIMADGHEIMSYFQNAAENHLTLPVPPVKAGKYCVISIMSYWQAIRSGSFFTSPYIGHVGVTFGNSVAFLEPTVADGQSGDTFTVNWKGHPELTGTALRLELWQTGRKLQDLGYVWDYTTVNGNWTGPMPHVKRGEGYTVRVVSIYQEKHAPYWGRIWGESDSFTLNAKPYVQVLAPAPGASWYGGTHHILWTCDSASFGTAARIELWRNHRFFMLLGYKWDCAEENDFEIPTPEGFGSTAGWQNEYKVRVVSLWQEAHPQPGIPADDFSDVFNISVQPSDYLESPGALSTWLPDENGKYRLSYRTTPAVFGTAARIDLWDGNRFFKTLAYNWNNQTTNSLMLDDPQVNANGRNYYIRVTSLWLEQHPTPMVASFVENPLPISISSAPPMYFRSVMMNDNNWGWNQQLSVQWRTDWRVVGMNFRIELWPKHPQTPNEHYFLANSEANTGDFYGENINLPPLPTDETQYYVRISSYWQEQTQGPYQYIETPWLVTVPYPRQ